MFRTHGTWRDSLTTLSGVVAGAALMVAGTIVLLGTSPAWSAEEGEKNWYDWFYPLGDKRPVPRFSDKPTPFKGVGEVPDRPALLFELGDPFLDTGKLSEGFKVPLTGAVWQPRLWSYMIFRSTVQSFDTPARSERETEWANRMDLFANLQLTGTEKIILGLRPVDDNRARRFTRYTFDGANEDFNEEFNLDIETLFFEGDIGSLFPKLDPEGFKSVDFGFTVGRQPITFQEGILINDTVDAVGFVRNNIVFPHTANFRVSGMWAWDNLNRTPDNRDGSDPQMFALFTAADALHQTYNVDLIYVADDEEQGDAVYVGLAAIGELGLLNTAFRLNSSIALDDDITSVADGVLLSAEFGWSPPSSSDLLYVNPFVAIENFTQAGRETIVGGPLAALGILFASPNLSLYGAEINPIANQVAGFAAGYQAFWDSNRRNLVLEMAGRKDTNGSGTDSLGFGFQLQQAVGRRVQLQLEGFYTINDNAKDGTGARAEVQVVY